MTGTKDIGESMRDIRAALEQARVLLLEPTPRNVDLSCTALSQAAARLQALPGRHVLRPEIETIARLLQNAATFHAGLFEKMNVASNAANDCAEPAATVQHIRVSA